MGDNSELGGQLNESVVLTGRIMMGAGIGLFLVVAAIFSVHLYTRWFWRRRPDLTSAAAARRDDSQEVAIRIALRKGLEPSVLKTIPEVEFSSKDFKEGLECVVCLCEVCEGEKTRFLPKCNHGFHVECIDTWFQSHSTCPLCRNPISNPNSSQPALNPIPGVAAASAEAPNFPTNVLYWGDETRVSTLGPCLDEPRRDPISPDPELPCSSSAAAKVGAGGASVSTRMLVIDIPRQIVDDDDQESPMIAGLRSLRRLLSRGKRVDNPRPRGPSVNIDVEQGGRS
ncbi:PREDICTED: RING-H2 finger protein ATL3-like [Ipomoea nil]|uniref:RING-H2 finger protein ATL3-like n=1 Tax=Ipomoea nil TaxID=35883 RepID=UPI00090090BE|nr:PREDICTED: RING-H2 finger protein ATL3-like [Ipomoea nil]